jgi:pimeloyl-ACP methyl ester carboxylesterase
MPVACPPVPLRERTDELDDGPVHWWEAGGGGSDPILWLHGVPNTASMWREFMARAGGVAVDAPGFGLTTKRADLDYSIDGYGAFVERFLDHLEWERVRLVGHDWGGGFALAFAQREPERVQRLALVNSVPFLRGYGWHRIARLWRAAGVGEMVMGSTNRVTLRLGRRWVGLPVAFDDEVLAHFDQGTQRAILKLYRSAPEDVLAAAGRRLGEVDCPALVVWGDRDPFIPARFGDGLAAALGDATVEHLPDAGHWPWLERPDLVARVCGWIAA